MKKGVRNLITDVPGVRVGHCTVDIDACHTGVTIVLPACRNLVAEPVTGACVVFNGYGKTTGLIQVEELGTLETPIALTNTLNVGKVHDAMVSYMINLCRQDGMELHSVNPVVCECNDSAISDIQKRPIGEKEVFEAIRTASDDFAQGSVGAGRGTRCYGLKGGIGSASRQWQVDGHVYTLGVLVQSNYGASRDLRVTDLPVDIAECDQGSIILVVATDLPVDARQLKRILRRCSVGMARLGSYIGHGSGEIAVGFSTSPRKQVSEHIWETHVLDEASLNDAFRAVGEASEEAILASMLHAEPDMTLEGKRVSTLRDFLLNKDAKLLRK